MDQPILQILVPQYKENEKIIKNLLHSIEIQQNISFDEIEVLIMNDGSDIILDKKFLNQYTFKWKYLLSCHKGVSVTRNNLLNLTTAKYVMFCDADDMFCNALGLFYILQEIKNHPNTEIIITPFYVENEDNISHEINYTINTMKIDPGIHGKVFQTSFLLENNIYFPEYSKCGEDSFFVYLAMAIATKIRYLTLPIYLWKINHNSMTNRNISFLIDNYCDLIQSFSDLIQELLQHKQKDAAQKFLMTIIYSTYWNFQLCHEFQDLQNTQIYNDIKYKIKTELYLKYWDILWKQIPSSTKQKYYNSFIEDENNNKTIPMISFKEWMTNIKEI